MKNIITIDEGLTYDLVIPGFIFLLFGAITCGVYGYIGIIFLLIGILCFAVKSGIQVDVSNRKIRKIKNLFGYKTGIWNSLVKVVSGKLVFVNETSVREGGFSMYIPRTNVTRAFELIFIDDKKKEIEFHAFTSYKPAKKLIELMNKELEIPVLDLMAERLKKSQSKRRR